MDKEYKTGLIIAAGWLLIIYLLLPFTPNFINFLYKQVGFYAVKQLLILLTISAALLVYLPFIKKFGFKHILPYLIVTVILAIACLVNIAVIAGFKSIPKIPARALHLPEYAILSVLLYKAFIIRYRFRKALLLSALTASIAGIIDERILQYLLPMRCYDITDILLNILGVAVGIGLITTYKKLV